MVLVVIAVAYTAAVVLFAVRDPARRRLDRPGRPEGGFVRPAVILLVGILIIVIGAEWLVDGAVDLATQLGVAEEVIGLTVVAIGSSAPELVTTVVSTVKGDRAIAVGNLIGSSVYNLALILGVTALVAPLEVTRELMRVDLPLMAFVAILLVPMFVTGRRVSRAEGVACVIAYLCYLGVIALVRT